MPEVLNPPGEPASEPAVDPIVLEVVSQFDEIVKPEGGQVVFLDANASTLRVRYQPGRNDECESCVMTSDTLAVMMKDMLSSLVPSISDVAVEVSVESEVQTQVDAKVDAKVEEKSP